MTDEELIGCKNVELSRDAIQYLQRLFNAFANTHSKRLEESGMERIFATTEGGIPWKVRQETQYEGGVTYENWLGLWYKYFS